MRFDDPYEILGISPEASDDEVKAAARKCSADEEKKVQAQAALEQITDLRKKEEKPEEKSAEVCEKAEEADKNPEASEEDSGEESGKDSEEEKKEEPEKDSEEEKKEEPEKDSEVEKKEEPEKISDEKPEKSEKSEKASPMQMAMGVVTIILLAAVLVALIYNALGQKNPADAESAAAETPAVTEAAQEAAPAETVVPTVPADGNPDDETCKGTYTGTDEEVIAAKDQVVATMGDYELRNSQLQIYYWMGIQSYVQNSGPYLQFMGLDVSQPLDVQPCPMAEGQTWQQFFVRQALSSWQNYQGMAAEAKAAGHQMDPELQKFLEELPQQIEQQAKDNQFADGNAMLANNVGVGASMEDYLNFMQVYNEGFGYFQDTLTESAPQEEQMEAYMTEHEAELLEQGISRDTKVATVRHILISPEDTESEEKWAEAEKKAQELLDQFHAGEETEDAFGQLAMEHTMDPGSKETGGLYQDFPKGQMVPQFEQWSFDEARKAGDTGIVKTDYGYHIMYFVATRPVWQEQVSQLMLQQTAETLIAAISDKYPMDIDFSKIVIGNLKEQEIAE